MKSALDAMPCTGLWKRHRLAVGGTALAPKENGIAIAMSYASTQINKLIVVVVD